MFKQWKVVTWRRCSIRANQTLNNLNPNSTNLSKCVLFNVKSIASRSMQIAAIIVSNIVSNLPTGLPIFSSSTSSFADRNGMHHPLCNLRC
ncbi:MAG: hypothetical protein WAV32_04215 [Halobacteriota archaeon]